jgi:hypothetical protein
MNKRAFLIHGWEGYPEEGWRPWLKKELENKGFEVTVLAMPDSAHPKMNAWLNHLRKIVKTPDENCYFVGHSLGCITILRYLENLAPSQKVGGVVLAAGFTSNLGYPELDSFFPHHVKWNKIKKHCKKFFAIHSDNDPYVSMHYADFFKKNLSAKIITEYGKKHMSGDDGINKLPSALKSVLKISD